MRVAIGRVASMLVLVGALIGWFGLPASGAATTSPTTTSPTTTSPPTTPPPATSLPITPPQGGDGIGVQSATWLDSRLLDLTVTSTVLPSPVGVRILVPAGYRDHPALHYPVLYLLHGGYGSYRDWTTAGQAEALTAGLPLIVVMPAGGAGGWYSNWFNGGAGGPPEWEAFHIDQLIPWVDGNFRTIADRQGRAIAGLSMGGFGALAYAARHPNLFAAVASFSGAVDMNNPGLRYLVYLSPLVENGSPGSIYGTSLLDNQQAEAHNPYNLADRLRGMHVALYTGDGFPGPLDPPGSTGYDYNEFAVHEMNVALNRQLNRLGIPHTFRDYGNGTHSWPYWNRDLQEELPAIMGTLARPQSIPTAPSPDSSRRTLEDPDVDNWAGTTANPDGAAGLSGAENTQTSLHSPDAQPPEVLHVSEDGTDNSDCSSAEPCRTVAHAVAVALPGDTVSVGPGVFTGNVSIGKDLTVAGSAWGTTLVGNADSLGQAVPTMTVVAGARVVLTHLSIRNANPLGDAVDSSGLLEADHLQLSRNGGAGLEILGGDAVVVHATISDNGTYGVANQGTLAVAESNISGNDYGLANEAVATISRTTVADNDSGGVVTLQGSTTVDGDTVLANSGEGVQAFSGSTTIEESTIAWNSFNGVASEPTPYAPPPIVTVVSSTISDNSPHGLEAVTPIAVAASIVSGDASGDCAGTVTDAGYDVGGDGSCPFVGSGSHSSGAELGPLGDNGGPTLTQLPERGSEAVNSIPPSATATINGKTYSLCSGTTDQRGVSRPQPSGGYCDTGSVELKTPNPPARAERSA